MSFSAWYASEFGKIRKITEEKIFYPKKHFQLSQKHLCKIWRAESIAVVAGRLVFYYLFEPEFTSTNDEVYCKNNVSQRNKTSNPAFSVENLEKQSVWAQFTSSQIFFYSFNA